MCYLLKWANKVFKFIQDKNNAFFKQFTEEYSDVGHIFNTLPLSEKNQVLNLLMAY